MPSSPETPTARTGLRGRPTAERSEAIETTIFVAARLLFLRDGFERTSMDAIAAHAGVSRTTLYARYKNKDVLLYAVIDAQVQEWGRQQRLIRDPLPTDFKQRMHLQARSIILMAISDDVREFQRLRRVAAAGNAEYARVMNEIGYRRAVAALERELETGCRDLNARPRSVHRVAEMLMALLTGWVSGHDDDCSISEEAAITYADHAVDVLFYGRTAW